jgi:hypothetical protein
MRPPRFDTAQLSLSALQSMTPRKFLKRSLSESIAILGDGNEKEVVDCGEAFE